jgi:hypothetical protein
MPPSPPAMITASSDPRDSSSTRTARRSRTSAVVEITGDYTSRRG